MDANISSRIQRIYAAIGRAIERDFSKFKPHIIRKPGTVTILQDFSGGQSQAELSEALHSLIANVASFHDHLKAWGRRNSVNGDTIHNFFQHSEDFCIVYDLWNRDKHGGDSRDGGWSKKSPRLTAARRVMLINTGEKAGSTATLAMSKDGIPIVSGDGDSHAVLTGEVVDKLGNGLGEAHEFIERSVRLCEAALRQFGVMAAVA